jgi:hypothetical protein
MAAMRISRVDRGRAPAFRLAALWTPSRTELAIRAALGLAAVD